MVQKHKWSNFHVALQGFSSTRLVYTILEKKYYVKPFLFCLLKNEDLFEF